MSQDDRERREYAALRQAYESELGYLEYIVRALAEDSKAVTGMSLGDMAADGTTDPHVRRILEGAALLTAKLQRELNKGLLSLAGRILELAAPYLKRVHPPVVLQTFEATAQARTPVPIARGTVLRTQPTMRSRPFDFRVTGDVTVYPIQVRDVQLGEGNEPHEVSFVVRPSSPGIPAEAWPTRLRLHVRTLAWRDGLNFLQALSPSNVDAVEVTARTAGERVTTAGRILRVAPDALPRFLLLPEEMAPLAGELPTESATYHAPLFPGFAFLQEFLLLPEAFACFDLDGLGDALRRGAPEELAVKVRLRRGLPPESRDLTVTLQPFCVPAVNLAGSTAESIKHDGTRSRHAIKVAAEHGDVLVGVSKVEWRIGGRPAQLRPFNAVVSDEPCFFSSRAEACSPPRHTRFSTCAASPRRSKLATSS